MSKEAMLSKMNDEIREIDGISVAVASSVADDPKIQDCVKFAAAVAKELEQKGIKTEPKVHDIMKTNGPQTGITFRNVDNDVIAPSVYPEKILTDGKPFEQAVQETVRSVMAGMKAGIELPELTAEEAKQHIRLVLVNAAQNQEMLEKVPSIPVAGGELAAVPRWYINEEASFLVTENLCGTIGITGDEALAIGQRNLESIEFQVQSMSDVLRSMMPPELYDEMPPIEGPQMLVVSSPSRIQGAAAVLDEKTMQEVHERLGGDFVVLPSSIHEVICLPITPDMTPEDLKAMVREVNGTQVAPEERLSDQVFRCDGHKLTVVGESFEMEQKNEPVQEAQTMKFAM